MNFIILPVRGTSGLFIVQDTDQNRPVGTVSIFADFTISIHWTTDGEDNKNDVLIALQSEVTIENAARALARAAWIFAQALRFPPANEDDDSSGEA